MVRRKRKRWDDENQSQPRASAPRPGGRWKRRLALFLVLVVAVVALLPMLVAKTPLRNVLVAAALPGDRLSVTIDGATLGWFSEPVLSQVEIRDAVGQPLVRIEAIRIGRSPWALLTNRSDLGEVEITRPTAYLVVRPDGSNLEDMLGQLAAPESAPVAAAEASQPSTVAAAIHVVEGTLFVQETATGRRWRAGGLDLKLDTHNLADGVGRIAAAGQLDLAEPGARVATAAGRFAVSLARTDAGGQQLGWQVDALSLAAVRPWLERFAAGCNLSGALSGQGTATWTDVAPQAAEPQAIGQFLSADFATTGSIRIDSFDATLPALAGDRVRLARVEIPWRLAMQPTGLAIEELRVSSELGQLAARGVIDLTALAADGDASATQRATAAARDLKVNGAVDLARLAAMLPRTLRIRGDTTITAGTIELAVQSQPVGSEQSFAGSVRTAGLSATSGGRPIRWDQPASVTFDLRQEGDAMRLESLRCESEFLEIAAAGTTRQLTADARFDLDRLAAQLGQFIDLSQVTLAGSGTAHVDWHQPQADQFTASANSELSQFRMTLADGAIWAEPRLAVRGEATGVIDPTTQRPKVVSTARLTLEAEVDQLDARLTAPVDSTDAGATWPVSVRATGSIARWLVRARPWFAPVGWAIDGQSELAVDAKVSPQAVDVASATLTITNLQATSGGWSIREPRLEISGDARWDAATGQLSSRAATIGSSTMAVATKDIRAQFGAAGTPQLTGAAAFRTDLARLAAWQATTGATPAYRPQGELTGNVRFAQRANQLTAELAADGKNLSLGQLTTAGASGGYQTIWQEPQLKLRGTAIYEPASDRLTLEQFQVASNTLQANVNGGVEQLSSEANVRLAGTLNYDLAQLSPLLRPYLGSGITFAGREAAEFQVAGSLADRAGLAARNVGLSSPATHWSRRIKARVEAPWSSANVYGLPVGGGRIAATLGDGALEVEPLALTVAEGRLTAAPSLRFDPQPSELTLPRGPLLSDVRISPEVSEALLKYIAPVLAGATRSEGKFSLALDGARVPVGELQRADTGGQLTVHSVRVVPGPMVNEWVGLAQQLEALIKRRDPAALAQRPAMTLLAIQDQQVNFRVVNGRVYHQNLEFLVDDLVVRSEGSVGLDETLQLVLHMPIPDQWVASDKFLSHLRGQTIDIPVGGTLTQPRIDRSAIASLSGQLLQGAAKDAVNKELNRALDKLFKSR